MDFYPRKTSVIRKLHKEHSVSRNINTFTPRRLTNTQKSRPRSRGRCIDIRVFLFKKTFMSNAFLKSINVSKIVVFWDVTSSSLAERHFPPKQTPCSVVKVHVQVKTLVFWLPTTCNTVSISDSYAGDTVINLGLHTDYHSK
jgi:hypothetical protein